MAILAVIVLLLQVQSGNINLTSMFSAPKTSTQAKKQKPPQLVFIPANPQVEIAKEYIEQRQEIIAATDKTVRETWQSFARMDERAAASILSKTTEAEAVLILSKLKERDLARILPAAEPQDAAGWVRALISGTILPPIPEEFKEQARQAGLANEFEGLRSQFGIPPSSGEISVAPPIGLGPGTADSASDGLETPEDLATETAEVDPMLGPGEMTAAGPEASDTSNETDETTETESAGAGSTTDPASEGGTTEETVTNGETPGTEDTD